MVSSHDLPKEEPPLDVERQVPLTEKHPPERLIPFAKVEVEVVELTERSVVDIPPLKVEVPISPTIVVVAVPPM